MMCQSSMWFSQQRSAHRFLLVMLVLYIQIVASLTGNVFQFTHSVYNGTLLENTRGKVYVITSVKMAIMLSDIYLMNVHFTILGDEEGKIFIAESESVENICFLRVRTRTKVYGMLNRERKQNYNIQIKAVGLQMTGESFDAVAYLNVTILDENEFSPLFSAHHITVSIPEDTPIYSSITQVTASDADVGFNGEVYYSIVHPTSMFSIHPTSGTVMLMCSLHSQSMRHVIEIHAEDRGLKRPNRLNSPQSNTILEVIVLSANIQLPIIYVQKLPALLENASIGSVFAVLKIIDNDSGINGVIGNVDIVDSDMFTVVRTDSLDIYNVALAAKLDRDHSTEFLNITIMAADKGSPPLSSSVMVAVNIQDVNDNSPQFEHHLYKANISEMAPIHTAVILIKAYDEDEGQNGQVHYTLRGSGSHFFYIDEISGLITTAARLNAETHMHIQLVVFAEDGAKNGIRLTGQTKLLVNIIDFNDNAPIFNEDNQQDVYVEENMPKGTWIVSVFASDHDSGNNGHVSYSIQNDNVPFRIDAFNGEIRTTEVLDFETMQKKYPVVIQASDWGSPFKRWTRKTIYVNVRDINDNNPIFENANCEVNLSRSAVIGTKILVLTAIDYDVEDKIAYTITSGNTNGCFKMEYLTGSLQVSCNLTTMHNSIQVLSVTACDGEHMSIQSNVILNFIDGNVGTHPQYSSTGDASVTCQDTNVAKHKAEQLYMSYLNNDIDERKPFPAANNAAINHLPRFSDEFPENLWIAEDTPVSTVLARISAINDEGGYGAVFLFSILNGNVGGAFKINLFTGELEVFSQLDHESMSEYNLTLAMGNIESDHRVVSKLIRIFISDVNDNPPFFDHEIYMKSVFEDVPLNTTLLQIHATDRDTRFNGKIRYSMMFSSDSFHLDSLSGKLRVKGKLDREHISKFRILLRAEDCGLHIRLSATTTVFITINDINDNLPEFFPAFQTVRVIEDLPIGTVVAILTARDADDAKNGEVMYRLVDGGGSKFHVDSITGAVTIVESLDYETTQVYNVSVLAEDGGDPVLESMSLLIIEVIDVNKNYHNPSFNHFIEYGFVKENSPVGTYVMTVSASDNDDFNGGITHYSIRQGSGIGRFIIDDTGTIYTKQIFDRETCSHFWLTIKVQDNGLTPRFGRLEVLIRIQDVNDNIPQSIEPAYYASVEENSVQGTSVVKVEATDGDSNSEQKLYFAITGGNTENFFIIDPITGLISTTNDLLDREVQEEHALEVTISDNGYPSFSSNTRVVIEVTDVNDNKPWFLDPFPIVNVLAQKHESQDIFVYRTVAYDRDDGENGEVTYNLKGARSSPFYINNSTGDIFSKKDLLHQATFDIVVWAVDNGLKRLRAQRKVQIVVMSPAPDLLEGPRFTKRNIIEQVMESDSPGYLVTMLRVLNPDPEISLFYAVESGDEARVFDVHPNKGSVLLARPVDLEAWSSFNLTLSVTDGSQKDFTWLAVEVLDINDHQPVFPHPLYKAKITESAYVGQHVLRIFAVDLDLRSILMYSIVSAGSITTMSMFSIGLTSGVIKVSRPLDREEMHRHMLTVMVQDQGAATKKSFTRVEIDIEDVNDHKPSFLLAEIEGRVHETASIGHSILQVFALDHDKGNNAELTYSILSGNSDSTFCMDGQEGILYVNDKLSKSLRPHFQLIVMASDHGHPPLSSTAVVNIAVTVPDNAPPKFASTEVIVELQENQPVGSIIGVMVAECQSTISYSITRGNPLHYFFINPNSGVVSTTSSIDYEEHQAFNLSIRSSNILGAASNAYMLVHIMDVNDNAPRFLETVFFGHISEGAATDSMVLTSNQSPLVILAEDVDSGRNSFLKFVIAELDARQFFSVHQSTGVVRVVGSLDHETTTRFNFTVSVHDLGVPHLFSLSVANVVVDVLDVNDNPPVFVTSLYTARLLLPTFIGVHVIDVKAEDPDVVSNMSLIYGIIDGNDENHFEINNETGSVIVTCADDFRENYNLTIQVSDGRFDTSSHLAVMVEQPGNRSHVRFTEEKYFCTVPENTNTVENLVVVEPVVTGHDQHYLFSLLNNQHLFSVGGTSGVVRTSGVPLDREQSDNYTLVIQVEDSRSDHHRMNILVLVYVTDENDNAPIIMEKPLRALASINAQHGEVVRQVIATDADSGENAKLSYFLLDILANSKGTNAFAINQHTGEVIVKHFSDTDLNTHPVLTVIAVDHGLPPRTSTADIHIHITDTSTPLFVEHHVVVSVPENSALFSPIIGLEAVSLPKHRLVYYIADGDANDDFNIDFNTGLIAVWGQLDRESTDHYLLTIQARDVQTEGVSYSDMHLTIIIEDVNDNSPVFENVRYTHTVSEITDTGTSIMQVTATDADSGANGIIYYSLASISNDENDCSHFSIHSETGVISLLRLLDHESQAKFTFYAVAMDSGNPVRSTTALVRVIVLDVNDNVPRFLQPSFTCYITDQARGGHPVIKIDAVDADECNAGKLVYSVLDGNSMHVFSIDRDSGLVSVSQYGILTFRPVHELNVSVSDGTHILFAPLRIYVRNANRHAPVFTEEVYHTEVSEKAAIGHVVVTVIATDSNRGNDNMLTYFLPVQLMLEVFQVDNASGEVSIHRELDREEDSEFEFTVASSDGGGRVGYCSVKVVVKDENDNEPSFSVQEYTANIRYDAPTGARIVQVSAADRDLGASGTVFYSLHTYQNRMIGQLFSMDSNTGDVLVKSDLSSAVNQIYQFFVKAEDGGEPRLENHASVEILVLGAKDTVPMFSFVQRSYYIQEDTIPGEIIGTARAESDMPLIYSIVPIWDEAGSSHATFAIDQSGQVRLGQPLDRETRSSFILSIKAQMRTSPSIAASCQMDVFITDVNDNKPEFESQLYNVTVIENADIGTSIIQLRARDSDLIGELEYAFPPDMVGLATVFGVDRKTGWVSLLSTLDREERTSYHMTVLAYEVDETGGSYINRAPVLFTASTDLIVVVTDFNDNAPRFPRDHYSVSVSERASLDTVILVLVASDDDLGVNADVRYFVCDGDPLGQFGVNEFGELTVKSALAWGKSSDYELKVAASDGAFATRCTVSVAVLDYNDHSPQCLETSVTIIADEDVAVNKLVAHVRAVDSDDPSTDNGRLSYFLHGDGSDKFLLSTDNGNLHTAATLDREVQDEYFLTATVVDGGGLSCSTAVHVFVKDVNDNPPEFVAASVGTVTVPEDAGVGTILTRMDTVDRDVGVNRKTLYRLTEGDESLFRIDSQSGVLSLVGPLDRERTAEYNVTIFAYNEITPELSPSTALRVIVLDVNDSPPMFERTGYHAAISEAAEVGTIVETVLATSLDLGANAVVRYSIVAGSTPQKFVIDGANGVVRLVDSLDHEATRRYFLTIRAEDRGSPSLSGTVLISVNVTDENDNSPQFSQAVYTASVGEMAPVGTKVFQVIANDIDSFVNSIITYSIENGNSAGCFRIGPQDGVILVSRQLDREKTDRYVLGIQARDSGTPMLYSNVAVNISVEDLNDNPPLFDHLNYTATVQEGQRTGIKIMKFIITDLDSLANGPPFSFDIISGNRDGEFHVDSNGVLYTAGRMSKQLKEEHRLVLRVFDNGEPRLHSDARVTLHVVEDGFFPPDVRNLSIHMNSCTGVIRGVIGQVEAMDRDPYDSLSFSIISPNRHLFDILRDDGRLIVLAGLDEGHYTINVSVTDGKYVTFGMVVVNVRCVSQDALDNSVAIRLTNLMPEQFYASHSLNFRRFLEQQLSVHSDDVEVINVQPSAMTDSISDGGYARGRRSLENDLDVLFAVKRFSDRYIAQRSLKRKLSKLAGRLEEDVGLHVVDVMDSRCVADTCDEAETCVGRVVFDKTSLVPVVVNGEGFVSSRHYYIHQCICESAQCRKTQCGDIACEPHQVCGRDLFSDSVCQCPDGRSGLKCRNVVALCSGSNCPIERSMTFSGRSYAQWILAKSLERHMALSLRIRTRQSSAVLMYTQGLVDYSLLEIQDGGLVYRFNCGSGETSVRVPVDIGDGQWHSVSVERVGSLAEVRLDDVYTAMAVAPGVRDALNLDTQVLYFGAKVDMLSGGFRDVSRGFEGCMEDIRMFNIRLPFSGSNAVAHSQEFQLVTFHCTAGQVTGGVTVAPAFQPMYNVCSSAPCLNGGRCRLAGVNTYLCVCGRRFTGPVCELDLDPCRTSPCFNNGQCQVRKDSFNSFICHCPGNLLGMRCSYGFNCRPNPCQHGATCVEGPTSALCHCNPGFSGLYCERKVNACQSIPCHNDGVCRGATGGGFHCNCSGRFYGLYCENIYLSSVGPVRDGIGFWEIYGIIGAVAGVALISGLLVAWHVWRRKCHHNVGSEAAEEGSHMLLNEFVKVNTGDLRRKISNPDLSMAIKNIPSQPPAIPNRPVSYTPSMHDTVAVLNNLGDGCSTVVESLGRCDDCRQHRLPDFRQFLYSSTQASPASCHSFSSSSNGTAAAPTSMPPPPSSARLSGSHLLHKAPLEFDYTNILGNFEEEKHRDNMAKKMPGLNPVFVNGRMTEKCCNTAPEAGSTGSLQVADLENYNGYHWDTSDWAERSPLPNVSEVPASAITDSPCSSLPSYNHDEDVSNERETTLTGAGVTAHDVVGAMEPGWMTDSEYVGETENELEFDECEEVQPGQADIPNYDRLLSLMGLNSGYNLSPVLDIHPDRYLPFHHLNSAADSFVDGSGADDRSLTDARDGLLCVSMAAASTGSQTYRRSSADNLLWPESVTSPDYQCDAYLDGCTSVTDGVSSSVGGYTSNVSCSDISALCQVEVSDVDSTESSHDDESLPCLSSRV